MASKAAYVLLAVSAVTGFVTLLLQFVGEPKARHRGRHKTVLALAGCGMVIGAAGVLLL
ncbi:MULTISPECIES: hypothetical protein [unclassified Streptomyces]|uniref:hypothetical protein n=1 Tax=unclassified Streptomyces TaxID=2593676 RepID=UPI003333E79A